MTLQSWTAQCCHVSVRNKTGCCPTCGKKTQALAFSQRVKPRPNPGFPHPACMPFLLVNSQPELIRVVIINLTKHTKVHLTGWTEIAMFLLLHNHVIFTLGCMWHCPSKVILFSNISNHVWNILTIPVEKALHLKCSIQEYLQQRNQKRNNTDI